MTPEQLDDLYAAVARKTREDPKYLGHLVTRYAESEELDWTDLERLLGTSVENVVLLCLCRTPRSDCFAEDLRVVCERTGAKEIEVARIIRHEQAILRWQDAKPATTTGWFLAASDSANPPADPEDSGDGN